MIHIDFMNVSLSSPKFLEFGYRQSHLKVFPIVVTVKFETRRCLRILIVQVTFDNVPFGQLYQIDISTFTGF